MKKGIFTLILASLFFVSSASATTITAMETINDAFDGNQKDYVRTRMSSNGIFDVENDDATIVSENSLSSNFGVWSFSDTTYSHDMTWIDPAADTFLNATLQIWTFSTNGNNDDVLIDETFNLGTLTPGSLFTLFFSNTIFGINQPTLDIVLADGRLDVKVDKSRFDAISVYKSKLTVDYQPVPEPSTLFLLGAGAIGLIYRKKRQAA